MPAPREIVELVERFKSNREAYKSGHYNETQVRREFVDLFFKAPGWDIDNEQGFAEACKDVIHEDAIKVGGTTRAPDYSFRIGGQRKFFLETKKPSVDIKEDIHPAFQLRRYAWTAKLPLSILTDFEEFSVYDCTIKPDKKDMPSKGRILYLTYKDYLEQWDELASIFSKNAILKGSFDKYAQDKRGKRGTAQVDAAFLEEIAGWREILARNIALRNPELETRDLNYAVQATVNRIVFLRICEDRGIERLMKMEDLLSGERVYPRLCELFRRADERYNSGIFHFEREAGRENPDTLSLQLTIDDKPLKEIIKRLYYPDSPYEFSVLPAEILGQVYEQFLGKVIRLTDGHRAVVEDKPEVKKAGGVKYTPSYIVDYIVKNTLGPTLKEKTPSDATKISVLDPACGSGSFLIVAYQHLLDWHREWYVQNLLPMLQSGLRPSSIQIRHMLPANEGASKGRKKDREPELPIFQGRGGEWRLTTAERKRILLNNIYGVDIDRQAVEVTKLSLLLKVLEGENEETISKQLKLFQERALPDLSNNIKCGNSLIGWDVLEDNPGLGQEEIERINPFGWEREFAGIMHAGGFHAIIGNPPYIRIQNLREYQPEEVEYFERHYKSATGKYDLYILFLEKATHLLDENGILGIIVPNKFLVSDYGSEIRSLLTREGGINKLISFGDYQIFEGVSIYTCLLFWAKESQRDFYYAELYHPKNVPEGLRNLDILAESDQFSTACIEMPKGEKEWHFAANRAAEIVLALSAKWITLKDFASRVFQGIITGGDKLFLFEVRRKGPETTVVYSNEFETEFEMENELLYPFLRGSNIRPYSLIEPDLYVFYPYKLNGTRTTWISEEEIIDRFPLAWNYLIQARQRMSSRGSARMKYPIWYGLWNPRDVRLLTSPKILVPTIANEPSFSIDVRGDYFFLGSGAGGPGAYGLILPEGRENPLYVLGLLNSSITDIFIKATSSVFRGGYYAYSQQFLWGLPFRPIDLFEPTDKSRHDRMVSLVDRMLALHKQLQEARTPHDETAIQRQIEATDRQIDALVYELYGLNEDEKKIVEDSTK